MILNIFLYIWILVSILIPIIIIYDTIWYKGWNLLDIIESLIIGALWAFFLPMITIIAILYLPILLIKIIRRAMNDKNNG